MSDGWVDYEEIPAEPRDLLRTIYDDEDTTGWWNLKSRVFRARPRELWAMPEGRVRVLAEIDDLISKARA